MNFRTVVQDGLIVVNTHGALPDGTLVEVSVAKNVKTSKSGSTGKRRADHNGKTTRTPKSVHVPGYGMWADREDLGPSETAVDRLRASTRRRRVA